MTDYTRIKSRYDAKADWTSANPTLLAGEIGIESDTGNVKVGTGSTVWNSLNYSVKVNVSATASSTSLATDGLLGNTFTTTLAHNSTLANPSNTKNGEVYTWIITQDGTGSRTLAFGNQFQFAGTGTINPLPNSVSVITGTVVSAGTTIIATIQSNSKAGTIEMTGGTAAPPGYLLCDGTSYARADYADLFNVIGTAYGTADGSSFNVPDMQGMFVRGIDNSAGTDPDVGDRTAAAAGGNTGDNVGSVQTDATALPNTNFATSNPGNHTHSYTYRSTMTNATNGGGASRASSGTTGGTTGGSGSHTHTLSGGDDETRPVNVSVNYIIAY